MASFKQRPFETLGVPLQAYSDGWDLWAFDHVPISHGIPERADWFEDELNTHHAMAPVLGIGCHAVIIKGKKEQFLDWLSCSVESGALRLPRETGAIISPTVNVKDLLPPVDWFLRTIGG